VLAGLLCLGFSVIVLAHGGPDPTVGVSQKSIEDLMNAALENAVATNGDKLIQGQADAVIANIKNKIRSETKTDDDGDVVFDDKLSHVIECSKHHTTAAERIEHLQECPT